MERETSLYSKSKENPFEDAFTDPLCKLNLKETSDFVRAFPMSSKPSSDSQNSNRGLHETSAQRRREGTNAGGGVGQRRLEAPSTPGRPVFGFSGGNPSRKSFPSKWDDAEKWLINSSSCHESPAHVVIPNKKPPSEATAKATKADAFAEKFRVSIDEKISVFNGRLPLDNNLPFHGVSSEILLKDKFTDNVEPIFPNFPTKEGFFFRSSPCEPMKDAGTEAVSSIRHRDIGTEMTPLGSSTTSRCHTPFKAASPARHNTPANRSGPLVPSNPSINISELNDCHFAKLDLRSQFDPVLSNWSSREEEEEEISKSLRHFEAVGGCRKSVSESRAYLWEDEERTKCCIRSLYQREAAKIQAWVNLQSAKAEAQSRKLEVKIQKMRSNLEEKLMKRMAIVHRRAEEWRGEAQLQHTQQMVKATEQAHKMRTNFSNNNSLFSDHTSCGCFFPCNNINNHTL
ncbi:hypothetical protein QJS04_geneDACA004836 [Acorus gramineus]|uniref:Remorin C-terminal domain-containing protein n=1 Tax=Acorus gramineus TaxID=55184 RepID=A0AAV9BT96_ACOGR|nr:hypothetical protein QJS04_geneDACA004836 [Acorus gramineus]